MIQYFGFSLKLILSDKALKLESASPNNCCLSPLAWLFAVFHLVLLLRFIYNKVSLTRRKMKVFLSHTLFCLLNKYIHVLSICLLPNSDRFHG